MKIYITKGTHWNVPNEPQFAAMTQAGADSFALTIVNLLRADLGMPAATGDWKAALVEAQRKRVTDIGDIDTTDSIAGFDLASAAEFDVWIDVLDLDLRGADTSAIDGGESATNLRTFVFDLARDGDFYSNDILATSEEQAQAMAVGMLNAAWSTSYPDWDDMVADSDAHSLCEHPAIMGQRLPLETIELYRALAEKVLTVVEDWRETSSALQSADYDALRDIVEALQHADPSGEPSTAGLPPIDRPIVVINISGGVMQGASSTVPIDVYGLDFDVDDTTAWDVIRDFEGAAVIRSEVSPKVDPAWVQTVVDARTNEEVATDEEENG